MLSNGFSESHGSVPLDVQFPDDQSPYTEEFEYESDSDLDDDINVSTLEIGDDNSSGPITAVEAQTTVSDQKGKHVSLSQTTSKGRFRRIVLKDVAHRTWGAFMFYLYTDKLNFSPLKSSRSQSEQALERVDDLKGIPSCSPKSMYRLAEKYGLPELQKRAISGIQAKISAQNIVQEVTTKFTSRYKEIQTFEIRYLCDYYTSPEVTSALPGMIVRLVNGELPHTGSVITELLCKQLKPADSGGNSRRKKDSKSASRSVPIPPEQPSSAEPSGGLGGQPTLSGIFGNPAVSLGGVEHQVGSLGSFGSQTISLRGVGGQVGSLGAVERQVGSFGDSGSQTRSLGSVGGQPRVSGISGS